MIQTKGNIPPVARGHRSVGPHHVPISSRDAATLTRLGCLFPRDMTEAGKAWPRLPTAALWAGAEPRSPCMSPWLLGMVAVWPTAWFLSTWMASSNLSSILFCLKDRTEKRVCVTAAEASSLLQLSALKPG